MKRFQTLLHIDLYEFTGNELGKLKKAIGINSKSFEDSLPKYCLHGELGTIRETEYHLQWIEDGTEKYLLFDAITIDRLLSEEISGCGMEDLLKDIDLRPHLEKFEKKGYDQYYRDRGNAEYLIVTLSYRESGSYECLEYDLEVEVEGKLKIESL